MAQPLEIRKIEEEHDTRTAYTYDNMYRVASAAVTTDTGLDLSVGYTYTDDLLTKIATPTTTYNFNYGAFGLRSNIKVGTQTLASYDYTDDGNFYLEKLAYGNSDMVQYTYDDQGRVTAQTWENGDTVSYQYDNSGALATVTDSATGYTTTYYYDFTDRLMKYVESGEGYSHSVGYEYDTINNLTALVETINGTAYTTSYTYDDDNRVSSITNGGSTQSVSYDAYGRVSGQVMKHNGTTLLTEAFTYRDFVKEIKTTLEDGQETTQTVNYTSGQVEKLNISTNENGFNTVYEYTYDANGNIASVKEGNKTTSYTYDSAGQLLRENNQAAGKTWVWTYDNAGNILTRKEYAYTTGTLGAVVDTVNYDYNSDNWGDLLTSYDGQAITYDNIGNPLDDGTWEYTWERGRQLASMTNGDVTIDYQYNSDGIRTKKVVTTTGDHVHSFQSNVVAPTCTENGYTLHSCVCGYIYQDAPVAAIGHSFTTQVIDATCTEAGHIAHTCECGYSYEDGANGHNFTTLVVEPSETVNGFTLHECDCGYSYESDPVASLGGVSAASEDSVADTKVYDYVYNGSSLVYLTITTNTYGESPVVETLYFGNGTVTYNGTVYYYVTNLQGDVIAILNSNGAAVVEYTYDAWGNILTASGSMASTLGAANPLTYRGYVYDQESSLYYLQSRYYSSNVGRLINADILVTTGQGILGNNMFAYCGNNPISREDNSGQLWEVIIGAAVGGAIAGAIIGAVSHIVSSGINGTEITAAGLLGAIATGAATGAIGAVAGALGGVYAVVGSVLVGTVSGVVTACNTEGSTEQKIAAGLTAGVVSTLGTYLGTRIPVALDSGFTSGFTSFTGGLFMGTQTEIVNVATQQVVSYAFSSSGSLSIVHNKQTTHVVTLY